MEYLTIDDRSHLSIYSCTRTMVRKTHLEIIFFHRIDFLGFITLDMMENKLVYARE